MEGGGSGVAAARVGRASGAGFSVYGGPEFLRTLCPMSARLLIGRLPNSHATVIAYGATVSRCSPLHLAPLLHTLWWRARNIKT